MNNSSAISPLSPFPKSSFKGGEIPIKRKSANLLTAIPPQQLNASNCEDENLLKTKRSGKDNTVVPMPTLKSMKSNISENIPAQPIIKPNRFKKKLKDFMSSRRMDLFIISLIVIYVLIVMANIVLDDSSFNSNDDVISALDILRYVELGILCIFILEIILKVIGSGLKGYFRDCWYILDAIIILATFALVIVDIELNQDRFSGLSKIRGLFRLFRIFMLMRKANQFSRITKLTIQTAGIDFKSPVEKILDLLESLKLNIKNKQLATEIDWAIDVISNNKLYEPLIDSSDDEDDKNDANVWLKNFSKMHGSNKSNNRKRDSKASGRELANRISILTPNLVKKESSTTMLQTTSISPQGLNLLENEVNDVTFDIMEFKKLADDNELVYMSWFLFQRNNIFEFLNISQDTFSRFMKKIQGGYLANAYHNATHAADVLQTVNYLMTTGEFTSKADLSVLEIAAIYLSAAIHDYEHPGTNNTFHINSGSDFAIKYNDKGVLENHHVAATFKLLKDESLNIFCNFSKADFKTIRERIIAMVLATDMSNHFADIGKLKGRLAADFDIKNKDKNFTMELLIHAADISNPTKMWDSAFEWTGKVMQEFFQQGDQERDLGLPITHLCDRYTVNIGKSQIGFIDFVVSPFYSLLKEILPKIDISNLEINKAKWRDMIDQYDDELTELNNRKNTAIPAVKIIG